MTAKIYIAKIYIAKIYRYVIDFFLSQQCLNCDNYIQNYGLCHLCWSNLFFISKDSICTKCGVPVYLESHEKDKKNYCEDCVNSKQKQYYNKIRSVFVHTDVARSLIINFKYNKALINANFIADSILKLYLDDFQECDLIIPVPIHTKKLIKKYYNHVIFFANIFYSKLKKHKTNAIYIRDFLIKYKETTSQATLNKEQRKINDHCISVNPFYVKKKLYQNAKKILIIDDIITTGSTMNYIAKIIKSYNPNCQIYCISFTRTVVDI